MEDDKTSVSVVNTNSQTQTSAALVPVLDLGSLPTVYILPTHLSGAQIHGAEDVLVSNGASLTYDIKEARLVLCNLSKSRRAKFELQSRKVRFRDFGRQRKLDAKHSFSLFDAERERTFPAKKRRRIGHASIGSTTDDSSSLDETGTTTTDSGKEGEAKDGANAERRPQLSVSQVSTSPTVCSSPIPKNEDSSSSTQESVKVIDVVRMVGLDWLKDSLRLEAPQRMKSYLIYEAEILPFDPETPTHESSVCQSTKVPSVPQAETSPFSKFQDSKGIIERAAADNKPHTTGLRTHKRNRISSAAKRDFSGRTFSAGLPHLVHQTTSEHDEDDSGDIPQMPDWVLQNQLYSCQRSTPLQSRNENFIDQLKRIKLARLLTNDEIGVRAYSTSIASLAAYPHPIQTTREILALPGCDQKIAHLFHEYQSRSGRLQAAEDFDADPTMAVLRLFYEIWGVGATTAREFYYDKKWKDLDDIVEFGWHTLSRVQQIGVKYYDEFLLPIPRAEVESIAEIVRQHACKVVDDCIECIIVGGYRRGKPESGDVDLIISHPEPTATAGLVTKVVKSLEREGWVTHTLTLNLTNTKRGQETLPFLSGTKGAGFDTLDKALVVWQDQTISNPSKGEVESSKRESHPHRRVDIIISPWRTVGCAVAGWTSGTTFQRDLRRYAKKIKGWKFDSSGVRERGSGRWIDLEGWTDERTRCTDWKEAEKRVFEGLGLVFREPWERCTG